MVVHLHELNKQAANSSDYPSVHVCFVDPGITYLFAHLLQSRGIEVIIEENLSAVAAGAKVVTEPSVLRETTDKFSGNNLLLVGNDRTFDGLPGIFLARPLTEEKVEHALDTFLSSNSRP